MMKMSETCVAKGLFGDVAVAESAPTAVIDCSPEAEATL